MLIFTFYKIMLKCTNHIFDHKQNNSLCWVGKISQHLHVLYFDRAKISLRFLDLRNEAMIESLGKTCEVAVHYNSSPHVMHDFTFQSIDKVDRKTEQDSPVLKRF